MLKTSRIRTVILHLGFRQHLVTELLAERSLCVQVHAAIEELAQLFLDAEERQVRYVLRLELDQHVNITVPCKVAAQYGTEKRQPSDMMPPTNIGDLAAQYFGFRGRSWCTH